ncbi:MAG TPA: recombination protein RecR [Leptospiraceae bacterium]|mgnify:CR=1 FL=1|nr:recombination protein RecR [Spirochaetaceae bacterium]HBS06171.1 recombination protein RecR [Leptospiraceae bacterium]|tara:strand:+ start:11930 stop:12526 length:597 start_codon:yes stop_codon:yes gene_type:complete
MQFPALEQLVDVLGSLPGVGKKSARRIAFHILKSDLEISKRLSDSIANLRREVRFCEQCGGLSQENLCHICSDSHRNQRLLCVVEDPSDIFSIEDTGEFNGLYHVLMGALSPLDGISPEDLRIEELSQRIETHPFDEIFIATNPTLEGDATAHYISELFAHRGFRFTRISHGIATGASIEYADKGTLARSIRERKSLE